MPLFFLAGAALGVVGAIGIFFIVRFVRRRTLRSSLKLTLLLVRIPKYNEKKENAPEKELKAEIGKFEQLLSNLSNQSRSLVFEVAVPHVGEEIHFYIAIPRELTEIAAKQVQSLWPGSSVSEAGDDYNIFNPNGVTAAAYLAEQENFALPIRTYAEMESDTFASILGSFTKVNEIGEGAALQIIVRSADRNLKKTIVHYIESLKRGEPAKKVLGKGFGTALAKFGDTMTYDKEKEAKKERDKVVDEDAVKGLEAKSAKPLFLTNVRILASAATPFQANDLLDGITAGFQQFASPVRNNFRIVKARNPKSLAYQFVFRTFESKEVMILSSEEIASFFHFPLVSSETPKVKWLKSKEAEPPPNLPSSGTLVGTSIFRGQSKPVYLTDEDRRRHVYAIGQTGTGKSTVLGNMIIEDIQKGKGACIIDPHGELVASILGHIPKERLDDVIHFDPGDLWRPVGLNMLDYNLDRPEEKTFIVNEMQGIFAKLFPESGEALGPMFQQYMRNALLLLMEDMANEPATLTEVPRVFTDAEYRKRKLARITNPVVIDFWEKEAVKAGGEASLANMTPYITSKFNNFIANDYVRPIIGQPKSAFNFRKAMDEGKILLINLSKGRIGDINANLLGMIVIGKILMSALSRVDIPDPNQRRDFYLYIDEFQNFSTDSIQSILSEARKYRLSLTMAHQFIAQLTEPIRDAVFGNVGSMLVFRVGAQDAEFLVKQFEPVFSESDLIGIDNLNAYAKVLINGETSKPFNLKIGTTMWAPGDKEFGEKIKEYSRLKYGADRKEVEDAIFARLRI